MAASDLGVPLNFAVVGIRGIGGTHIRAITEVADARLGALCDIAPEARMRANELGVKYYDRFDALLEDGSIDVISICTPHWLHARMALDALAAGKHVLVEKPVAINLTDADAMVEAAERTLLKVAVAHQYRAEPRFRAARCAIEGGRLGDIVRVVWTRNEFRTQAYYNRDPWRGRWGTEGGGVLINQSIHDLDLLCWLVGNPVEVSALVDNRMHSTEVEDIACAAIRFENGALASVQFDLNSVPAMAHRVIAGEHATLDLSGEARIACTPSPIRSIVSGEASEPTEPLAWDPLEAVPAPSGHAFIVTDLVAAIRGNRGPFVDARQGRLALELMLALIQSALTGRRVGLPLDRHESETLLQQLESGSRRVRGNAGA